MNARTFVLPLAIGLTSVSAIAAPIIVTHDLTELPAGQYSFSFGLLDGSGTNDGNALVQVSGFSGASFTAGAPLGDVAGDPATGTLELRDTQGLADWAADFTISGPTVLTFVLDLVSAGADDSFVYRIYRENFVPVQTGGLFGVESMGSVATSSGWATPVAYAGTGPDVAVKRPTFLPVPEPASVAVLALGLATFRRRGGRR